MPLWIPLMDYAIKHGVSLSTLRRHIKANKIQYKVEHGRYLLLDQTDQEEGAHEDMLHEPAAGATSEKIRDLSIHLQKAQEEIAELKTLIAFYEERIPNQKLNS